MMHQPTELYQVLYIKQDSNLNPYDRNEEWRECGSNTDRRKDRQWQVKAQRDYGQTRKKREKKSFHTVREDKAG